MNENQTKTIIAIASTTIVLAIVFIIAAIVKKKDMEKATKDLDFDFIKEFETGSTKPRLTVFKNAIDGNKEVGFGHVLSRFSTLQIGDTITEAQADEFFKNDIEKAYNVYSYRLAWNRFTDNQKRAIISHAYNTGARSETITKLANAGKWSELATWWKKHYITSGGKTINGLVRRRAYEADLLTK